MNNIADSLRRPLPLLLIVLLASLGLATTASAGEGSIVFIKKHDIWISDPDGSNQHRITWDGTEGNPYLSPSQADDGTIAAGHLNDIVRMKQNGDVINEIDPPALRNSVGHLMDRLPVNVAISPDGKRIAWSFVGYECDSTIDCGIRTATGYTDANRPTPVSKYGSTFFSNPSWAGNSRTIQSGGFGSQVMIHDPGSEPVHWFDDSDYAEYSTDLSDSELSTDGSRLATVRGYGSDTQLFTYVVSGNAKSGPVPGVPSPDCMTGTEEGIAGPTWAPDNSFLAWENDEGIWTGDLGNCASADPKLVIPGGSEPDWGPVANNPGPGGVRLPFTSLKRALRKGLPIDFISTGKSTVRFKVKLGRNVVASDQGVAPNAGPMRGLVKFTRSARKRLLRMRKVRLTVSVTQSGKTTTGAGVLTR